MIGYSLGLLTNEVACLFLMMMMVRSDWIIGFFDDSVCFSECCGLFAD